MTLKKIYDQIATIKEATDKAAASPEAALEFLRKAGIVPIGGNHNETVVSNGYHSQIHKKYLPR